MNPATGEPASPPTHEALWPSDLFDKGIGWVILARFKAKGQRVQAGIFLVDVQCLGVKLAFYEDCHREDYLHRIRGHYQSDFPMVPAEPACARKLVEQAVHYAQNLGFAPHPDYKLGARVFGGINAADCPLRFTFGKDGKPFYFRGPRETEAQATAIVRQLEKRCGPGNYDYIMALGDGEQLT
jgi:hypothetical protein